MTTGLLLAHGEMSLAPMTVGRLLTDWSFDPAVVALLMVAAGSYLYGNWRVDRRHPAGRWSVPRTMSFLGGLLVVAVATMSGVGTYDDTLFWIHMLQHLLLIMVAPPLLVAGRPFILLLHALRNPVHRIAKRVLRSAPVATITFPPVVVAVYAATIVGTHLTGFMDVVLTHPVAHDGEHLLYLFSGYLYFLLIFGDEPIRWHLSGPAKIIMIALSMPIDTFTGVVLLQTGRPPFAAYVAQHRNWGPAPLTDVHWGGAMMWIGGDSIMLVLIIIAFSNWWSTASRHAGSGLGWVEQARLRTLAEHLVTAQTAVGDVPPAARRRVDPDNDDNQLAAYNAWLARLNKDGRRRHL